MKIKKFVGFAVAALSCLFFSSAVNAATSVYISDVAVDSGQAEATLTMKSTDIQNLGTYTATVNFDTSKLTFIPYDEDEGEGGFTDLIVNSKNVPFGALTEGSTNAADGKLIAVWYTLKNDRPLTNGEINLFSIPFKVASGLTEEQIKSSIKLTLNEVATADIEGKILSSDKYNSYVQFSVPKTLTSKVAGKGAIVGMGVQIGSDVYTDGTDGGLMYAEDGDNYVFTVMLKPSEKKTVDVSLVAFVSDKDTDTAKTSGLSTFVVTTQENVEVEKLS